MKKTVMISTFVIMGLGAMPLSYSAHPQSKTSKQQVQQIVVAAPASAVAKSPWSGRVTLDMERAVMQKPLDALSNKTTVDIGRVLFGDVSLGVRGQWKNSFSATEEKQGSDRYLTPLDPSVSLSKGSLLEVAGVKIGGALRAFIPATYASRADGIDRNPHLGFYRYEVTAAKEIGAWSLSALHRITQYNYQRALDVKSQVNGRFGMLNEVAAGYKLNSVVSISSLLDFATKVGRHISKETFPDDTGLDWTTSLDMEPVKNLAVSAGITFSAPEQTLARYFQDGEKTRAQSRLDNTKGGLTVVYTFL